MKKISFVLAVLAVLFGCSRMSGADSAARSESRVVIALLDTGVSTKAVGGERLLPGHNYVTDSDDTEDLLNHGTAVASAILGCESAGVEGRAGEAFLVPLVVVTKRDGKITGVSSEILAQAIRDSVDVYGADIINVSLGVHREDDALLEAAEYAEERGVLIVAAVGNGGADGKPYFPAAYPTVLSVGSCDADGVKSPFTQEGADILAQGESLSLASRNGRVYGVRGTSYATGYVSADAANLLLREPALTPEELRDRLMRQTSAGKLERKEVFTAE